MKRTISLVIALTVSFVMMFSSIAQAEEIKEPISVSTLEPTKLEMVQAPTVKTNKADCPLAQAKDRDRVLEVGKQVSSDIPSSLCNVICSGGYPGYWSGPVCVPCGLQNNAAN